MCRGWAGTEANSRAGADTITVTICSDYAETHQATAVYVDAGANTVSPTTEEIVKLTINGKSTDNVIRSNPGVEPSLQSISVLDL